MVVSRCVALPGDVVKIIAKQLYVNYKPAEESAYVVHQDPRYIPTSGMGQISSRDNFGPLTVPAGEFFALGDNRDNSWDSRFSGPIPQSSIVAGGVIRIYLSRDSAGRWRWNRIGALVH